MNASNRVKLAQFEDGSESVSESEIVELLSHRDAYSDRCKSLSIVETHAARVFLTDRHACKLKKRVKMPFRDFTSLSAREGDLLVRGERTVRHECDGNPRAHRIVPLAVRQYRGIRHAPRPLSRGDGARATEFR